MEVGADLSPDQSDGSSEETSLERQGRGDLNRITPEPRKRRLCYVEGRDTTSSEIGRRIEGRLVELQWKRNLAVREIKEALVKSSSDAQAARTDRLRCGAYTELPDEFYTDPAVRIR